MKKIAIPDVEVSIARRSEIKDRMQEITSLLNMGRLASVRSLGTASADANSRFTSFINQHGNGSESNIPEGKESEYRAIKEDADRKHSEYVEVQQKVSELRDELAELKIQLESLGHEATVDNVLMYQSEAATIENDIAKMRQVIASEEKNVALGESCNKALESLHRERENLMANIALGESTDQQRLDEIAGLIAKEEEQIRETKNIAESAAIIIAGLQRRIEEATQSLHKVKEKQQIVYGDFLLSEAEREGSEFVALSDKLWEKYSRLLALGTMVEQHPTVKGPSIISGVSRNLRIPSFNLKSCQNGCRSDGFRYTSSPFNVNSAIDAAKRDIAALGIDTASQ